jgi:hypothetical protein
MMGFQASRTMTTTNSTTLNERRSAHIVIVRTIVLVGYTTLNERRSAVDGIYPLFGRGNVKTT